MIICRILDPVHNTISQVKTQYRDPNSARSTEAVANISGLGRRGHYGDSHTICYYIRMFDEHGTGLVHRSHTRQRESRLLQAGIDPDLLRS